MFMSAVDIIYDEQGRKKPAQWVLLGFSGFTGLYWALLGFTGLYWALLGFWGPFFWLVVAVVIKTYCIYK